jgi:hypothetical protein
MGGIQHQLASVLPNRFPYGLFELVPLANSDEFVVVQQLTEILKISVMLNGKLVDEKPLR